MRDAFDFLDHIDAQIEFERRQKLIAYNKAQAEIEERKQREAKARVDALTKRANESFRRGEYERAGVAPPITDDDGNPTVSLTLLLSFGWRIEQVGEDRVLVRP